MKDNELLTNGLRQETVVLVEEDVHTLDTDIFLNSQPEIKRFFLGGLVIVAIVAHHNLLTENLFLTNYFQPFICKRLWSQKIYNGSDSISLPLGVF